MKYVIIRRTLTVESENAMHLYMDGIDYREEGSILLPELEYVEEEMAVCDELNRVYLMLAAISAYTFDYDHHYVIRGIMEHG